MVALLRCSSCNTATTYVSAMEVIADQRQGQVSDVCRSSFRTGVTAESHARLSKTLNSWKATTWRRMEHCGHA